MSIKTDETVIKALKVGESDNLIRLSTGVVLRGKPANATTLIMVLSHFKRPEPPVWYNSTMGRNMENPDDPDYKSRVEAWKTEQGDAVLSVLILDGTELVSVPQGIPGPFPEEGKTDWIRRFELYGLPMKPEDQDWRYLTWVKNIACGPVEDTKLIQEVVGRLSGVSKKDVQAAEDFPRSQEAPGR